MRLFIAFLFFSTYNITTQAQSRSSTAYTCAFADELTSSEFLRLKEYRDPVQNIELGKVDLLNGSVLLESTPTKVYQIPLWERQIYIQIWYANNLRIDAQLSLNGGNRQFPAVYHKDSRQRQIFCTRLSN